jgi:hypothetical protein
MNLIPRENLAGARSDCIRGSSAIFDGLDWACLLPRWPEHRLFDLAPVAWPRTRDRGDVRGVLGANQFRKLTLDTRG